MPEQIGHDDILIRPLAPDDGDRLAALFAALGEQSRSWFHPHPFERQTVEALVSKAGEPTTLRYLMLEQGAGSEQVVGYGFLLQADTALPVLGIAIADHAHGHGLGERLLRHLIEVARHTGKQGIQLTVYDDNLRARRLYERCGFVTRRLVHHLDLLFDGDTRRAP
jgi:ribosomal protein S18 acetylase RimI-like enzyme